MPQSRPNTLGQLKLTDYHYRSVKQEMRENMIARLRSGQDVFPGIIGYRATVLPQIIHAILSRHDMLFLGLRGQAKTRILRMLPNLLDEWLPVLADVEIPDDPVMPMTTMGRRVVAEQGDGAGIRWLGREDRYHEKLATPDVTIADLIGEIDIVKHAEGRYLSDESTMHFGLIPRTNRGIFAINELPDLSPRIQVGLFNVLEERDVQIRGYPIRLSLDVCLAFSANPEDYTNRGRIVTPLKDRIGSVIRTHYPQTIDEGIAITQGNAWLERSQAAGRADNESRLPLPVVDVPPFMHQIVEQAVVLARKSPHINQASGVSVRTSMACAENMVSSAERRGRKSRVALYRPSLPLTDYRLEFLAQIEKRSAGWVVRGAQSAELLRARPAGNETGAASHAVADPLFRGGGQGRPPGGDPYPPAPRKRALPHRHGA